MFADLADPQAIDQAVRARLADSIDHIADRADRFLRLDRSGLEKALDQIRHKRQDPGVFARYFELVPAVTSGDFTLADRLIAEIVGLAHKSMAFAIVPYDEATLGDDFERFPRLLFSEFSDANPMATPGHDLFAGSAKRLHEAIEIIRQVDAGLHAEISALLVRIIVSSARHQTRKFDGVTSFMVWGATFINADSHQTLPNMVHFLVHEITHSLLFGLSTDAPLVLNSPTESYLAPLRTDPRPMDGIYHATLVCARLAAFDLAWLDSDCLERTDRPAIERAANEMAMRFRKGVDVVAEHGELSELGRLLIERSSLAPPVPA